ncbi:hypothetical protein SCORR_v1c03900 [Spiroplasma corruscae]|uniref:Transmembrane protein n=1 Tax=Spiroplasma corruscae TaxID=216934 RepID=A0A222EPD0_9MOLU|nr:hypothetical protein [Spiroplasma corruscae]ASP28164.1 hypothetical protein SCORR_v1c03900 [Spiroplasma corruscae]
MKNNINPKSFIIIKFLFTIGFLFLYSASFLLLIKILKEQKEDVTLFIQTKTYLAITIFLVTLGLVCFIAFLLIRININKKTKYIYSKKEKLFLYISVSLILVSVILSIFTISSIYIKNINLLAVSISVLSIQVMFSITCSILEGLTRMKEQQIINSLWFENELKENTKNNNSVTKPKKLDSNINPFKDGDDKDD